MMEPGAADSGRRDRRRGRNRQHNNSEQRHGGRPAGRHRRRNRRPGRGNEHAIFGDRMPPREGHDASSILGGRATVARPGNARPQPNGPPDGFALFCACHLGITHDDRYREQSFSDIARQFGISPEEMTQLLVEHRVDRETLDRTDFDLHGAQLDIRLAPEGISRTEIARDWYDEYMQLLSE